MPKYRIEAEFTTTRRLDLEAPSPREAAELALKKPGNEWALGHNAYMEIENGMLMASPSEGSGRQVWHVALGETEEGTSFISEIEVLSEPG